MLKFGKFTEMSVSILNMYLVHETIFFTFIKIVDISAFIFIAHVNNAFGRKY